MSDQFSFTLEQFKKGVAQAESELINAVYKELRTIAKRHLSRNRWIATLNTTVLVNESYFRLVSASARNVENKGHFLNLASQAMRQIICDYARKRLKYRASPHRDISLHEEQPDIEEEITQAQQCLFIDEALIDLARINERYAKVVECRFFCGLSEEETALALNTSLRTVQRSWFEARQWLADYLQTY